MMVDKQEQEQDPFVAQEQHAAARAILRKHYHDEIRRAAAQHLNAEYARSQIAYDEEHRPDNNVDLPVFAKKQEAAEQAFAEHEALAMDLRDALKALGEVFSDEDRPGPQARKL